jgi:hypothetical protein
MELKANKGEWSELYTLVKLLADGKLFQSDINLKKDHSNIYEIIKAYKSETNYSLEFERSDKVSLYKTENKKSKYITTFSLDELKDISNKLYTGIKKGKGSSFSIIEVDDFLESSLINKIKADPESKADIILKIYDHRLAKEADLGFSIKSLIGESSTLFNTGSGNNFIFEIANKSNIPVDEFNKATYIGPNRISKITYRLNQLVNLGCKIKFKEIQSNQLWKNLKMIDGDLPEIIAYSLKYRWIYRLKTLKKVTEFLEDKDPLNFYENEKSEQKFYEYKIKKFLSECTMGMTSETPWHGEYDSFGGAIFVKKDGDIVCFHIYDFNLLRNYLLNNTYFEQAGTGEDKNNPGNELKKIKKKKDEKNKSSKEFFYGWLYEEQGNLYFKINLQIRFKKNIVIQ